VPAVRKLVHRTLTHVRAAVHVAVHAAVLKNLLFDDRQRSGVCTTK